MTAAALNGLSPLTATPYRTGNSIQPPKPAPSTHSRASDIDNGAGAIASTAGEEIRYMTRARAHQIGLLPAAGNVDWWLQDDVRLIVMHFDADGHRIRSELVHDTEAVMQARTWRDLAVRHSAPLEGA